MNSLPLTGNLKSDSLPRVLSHLNRQRVNGTLIVKNSSVTKRIFIKKGEAIFASSTYEDDRLGEMLLKAGKITVQQYDRSVEMLKKTGKRQGAILVELGYLTPKDLFWGVKYQVTEIIYSLFQFEDADYEFDGSELKEDEVIILKMSMGNLIYEGVKRIENWTRIRKEMPDTETVLKLSDDPLSLFREIELTTQDKKILSLVDGKRTIKKIIEDSWLNSFEALKALYLLWSIGIVVVGTSETKTQMSVDEILTPLSEEDNFTGKVNGIYDRLSAINCFELLEVDESADSDTIRKNYYALAKEFHPDRFFDSTDPIIKDKLTQIFDALTDAYNAIRDEGSRKQYLASIGRLDMAMAAETAKAKEKYKSAIDAMKAGKFSDAVEFLKEAVEIDPQNADYWNYLALAHSKVKDGFKSAEQAIIEAIRLEPTSGEYYANLGLLYLMSKRIDDAKMQFHKALALDPDNAKAKKGMSQIK